VPFKFGESSFYNVQKIINSQDELAQLFGIVFLGSQFGQFAESPGPGVIEWHGKEYGRPMLCQQVSEETGDASAEPKGSVSPAKCSH
jgi:hypothetical protein